MNQNYRNSLYSNSTESSRNGGGTWVYVNGELYHAGRLGMKWGKHLPGTDWWKEATKTNLSLTVAKNRGKAPSFLDKVRANVKTAGQAAQQYGRLASNTARAYGASVRVGAKELGKNVSNRVSYAAYKVKKGTSKLWNKAKGYGSEQISKLKESAYNAYLGRKKQVLDFFSKSDRSKSSTIGGNTFLDNFVNTQLEQASEAWTNAAIHGGTGKLINSFIQTAQYKISKGVNNYLKSIGMDDEVDRFLSKFLGKKSMNNINSSTSKKRVSKADQAASKVAGSADKRSVDFSSFNQYEKQSKKSNRTR